MLLPDAHVDNRALKFCGFQEQPMKNKTRLGPYRTRLILQPLFCVHWSVKNEKSWNWKSLYYGWPASSTFSVGCYICNRKAGGETVPQLKQKSHRLWGSASTVPFDRRVGKVALLEKTAVNIKKMPFQTWPMANKLVLMWCGTTGM